MENSAIRFKARLGSKSESEGSENERQKSREKLFSEYCEPCPLMHENPEVSVLSFKRKGEGV